MKSSDFLDRLIERLDRLDPTSVQGYILKLVREKGLLETVFQTLREGVIIIDRELKVHYVNNAAIQLLGLPADIRDDENVGIKRYLRDLEWDRLMSEDPEEWERASRQEIEVFYPEHRYLQFYLLPYKNEQEVGDAELSMATIILHDVTEQRTSTESAIESERIHAITLLAGAVAHEIGNPLNTLKIHLQLLDRHIGQLGENDNGDAGELVKVAMQEVNRLDTVINQFLKAIRPTEAQLKRVALKDIIKKTLSFMKHEVEDRRIAVECEWPADVPAILGDPTQLQQAFYNIISNAIQAMQDGGTLNIRLAPKADAIVVTFADTGKGIAAEQLSDVFNPYFTTRKDGTGLGLVIVERIIREHGAELGVESDVGRGTVFTIRFPIWRKRTRLLTSSGQDGNGERAKESG